MKPPGTILQHLYLSQRIERLVPGRFVEVGPGRGDITALLLEKSWSGVAVEVDHLSAEYLKSRFESEIASGRLVVLEDDFLGISAVQSVDLVISSMVMEHLDQDSELAFMDRSRDVLRAGGLMIGLVPAGARYWGIEDAVAGHMRRYERSSLRDLAQRSDWEISHVAGLTFPVSNILLPLSNLLVGRAESDRLEMTAEARTRISGRREVAMKTRFPDGMKLLLNDISLRPLHWVQKLFRGSERCLVLYFEARCLTRGSAGT
jgi:SAM-dependent methyltransferase